MRAARPFWFLASALTAVLVLPRFFAVSLAGATHGNGSVTFEDRSGVPMGTILNAGENRRAPVSIDRVSPYFLRAILAAEDRRYYLHGAVDWLALARTALKTAACVCNAGGASTISMQVARIHFDLPGGLRGKLLQLWDAQRIEAGSGKRAILQSYVNGIAMGGNVYGVEAASREYLGVPAADLDLAQAALLAGIPNGPGELEPREHWAAARARQRYVLQRMAADGYITASQAAVAARENVHLRPQGADLAAAQQLLFRLAADPGIGNRVRTTIDLPLQRFVQAQAQDVVRALSDSDVTQAAALVVDNRTGDVLAYLGSLDYFDDAYFGRNDGVRSLRQPGSTLKPFLYELALESGAIRPDTVLSDVPTSYAIPGARAYSPKDYSTQFAGPVSVRTALADSLNVPAVRVLSRVGVPSFLDRLHELGFERLRRAPAYYGLGLTLGAGEVTLWDLTHAYVTLARAGDAIPLRTRISPEPPQGEETGSAADWLLVTDILADRYARERAFGLGSVLDMPFPAAVKTGTSSGYRDTWTVGYTPEYTVSVWVGNFTGAPMRRISGVAGAGPLWNRIMLHLYERRDPPRFASPPFAMLAASRRAPLPAAANAPQFDEWRAAQNRTTGTLRILFPHDGDLFEDALAKSDPRRSQQQIAFRISRPAQSIVEWSLNGRPLQRSGADAYYWTVQTGRWRLSVKMPGGRARSVNFTVVPRVPQRRRGFVVSR